MPTFTTISALNQYIKNVVKQSIQTIAEDVREEVYEEVSDKLLNNHSGGNGYYAYQHTFEVLESICEPKVKYVNNTVEVEIYYDTDKIQPHYVDNSFWNQHMSITGEDVSEILPLWLEEGTTGGLYPREGWGIIKEWQDELKRTLKRRVQVELLRKGIKTR